MAYDVVIIGAGLGGLECGLLLSKAGKHVVVLEQGAKVGGCIQSYDRRGYTFDTGFHYVGGIGEGQTLYDAFRIFGLLDLPWQRLDDEGDILSIEGQRFALPQGYDNYRRTLTDYFPRERDGICRYVDMLRHCGEHQLDVLIDAYSSNNLVEVNAYQYLKEVLCDDLLVDVVSGTALKMELRKSSLPLFTFAHVNGGYVESTWRLNGSGQIVADTLLNGITTNGGEVVCRKRVNELVERDGKMVAAICADGDRYGGDTFISDVHPSLTCGMLKRSARMRSSYRNRITRLDNTRGMFTASLVLKPDAAPYFNSNYYVYSHSDVWAAHENNDPVSCVMVSCEPKAAAEKNTRIDLLTPMPFEECDPWSSTTVGRRGAEYMEMKKRKAMECIALAESFVPGLSDMVEECYTSTPLTWRDYTIAPNGTAYGVRKDYADPLSTMLSVKTPIPNLLLTGQSIIVHGLHGVTMAALLTCAHLLGREYIIRQLNNNSK